MTLGEEPESKRAGVEMESLTFSWVVTGPGEVRFGSDSVEALAATLPQEVRVITHVIRARKLRKPRFFKTDLLFIQLFFNDRFSLADILRQSLSVELRHEGGVRRGWLQVFSQPFDFLPAKFLI